MASGFSVVFWKLSAAGSTYFQLFLNKILWILFFSLGILTSAAFARGFSLGFMTSGELFLSLGVFPASIFFCFVGFGLASPLERSVSISSFEEVQSPSDWKVVPQRRGFARQNHSRPREELSRLGR